MKMPCFVGCLTLVVISFSAIVPSARGGGGAFAGLDEFGSASKDAAKWGDEISDGGGALVQTNGRVQYVTSGTVTFDDFMAWPWNVGLVPFDSDWSVQVDVSVPFLPLAGGNDAVGVGLAVLSGTNIDHVLTMNLEQVRTGGGPQQQNFFSSLDGALSFPEEDASAPFNTGAVQIRWDAASRVLTASYDTDGAANGYNWVQLRTADPTDADIWGMSAGDCFTVAILGYSEGTAVSLSNNVSIDNFYLQDGARPALRIEPSGANAILSWPGQSVGYRLEEGTSLTGAWTEVAAAPALVNDRRQVSVPATGTRFFQLKKP